MDLNPAFQNMLKKLDILRPYALHLAALGAALMLGTAIGVFKVSREPPAVDTADRWPFPQWAPYKTGLQRDALARAEIWAADPTRKTEAVEKKPAGPPWRFIGVVQEGAGRVAVIELDQGKRIQRIVNGAALPNGAVIKKIDSNELVYDENGEEKVLKLFSAAKMDNPAAGSGKK